MKINLKKKHSGYLGALDKRYMTTGATEVGF